MPLPNEIEQDASTRRTFNAAINAADQADKAAQISRDEALRRIVEASQKDVDSAQVNQTPEISIRPAHYNHGKIENMLFIEDNGHGLSYCAGNIIKLIGRLRHKDKPSTNLEKIIWYSLRLMVYFVGWNKTVKFLTRMSHEVRTHWSKIDVQIQDKQIS